MLPEAYRWIEEQFEPEGDPWLLLSIAAELEQAGDMESAATVLDRAYGIAPEEEKIRTARIALLDRLAVYEHGILFRYIPGGPFLMGSRDGEPDEQPLHPVWLSGYWLSDTPISWATYCLLMEWEPPPAGVPRDQEPTEEFDRVAFHLRECNKIRLQYCEDRTTGARDWHAHSFEMWRTGTGQTQTAQELFGSPSRSDPEAPWEYSTKPMVAVAWQEAEELAQRLTSREVLYALPSEAQWEKAARGGLIGSRYPWGEAPPDPEVCDFDRFSSFAIQPMRTFPPNGYGLFAMTGCVWEWTRDWYDRDAYRDAADRDPEGPATGEEKVLRGGSWSDCAAVLGVTFRMSRPSASWRSGTWGGNVTPNIGFRLCRMKRGG